jgi:hypothetical protein
MTDEYFDGTDHRATATMPLHQQALNQRSCVISTAIRLKALDKLASTVLPLMILLAIVNATIFLILRRSTSWTCLSDDHGFLLTSIPLGSILGQQ